MAGLDQLLGGDVVYVAVLLLPFIAIVGVVAAINALMSARVDVMEQRLRRATFEGGLPSSQPPPPVEERSSRSLLGMAFSPFARVATPTDEDEAGRLRAQLMHAGLRAERAMPVYLGAKVVLALGFAALFLWLNSVRPSQTEEAALWTIGVMIAGFYLPNLWLRQRVQERIKSIGNSLPDALDLLVTCVEAGLGLDLAMTRVAQEVGLSAPLLAQELQLTSLEMRAGINRGEAFRRLALRTGVDEIKNLASIIIQTELFGTSVSRALKVMAEGMRVRRMHHAEEDAATVAVRMTIPLVVCILPALLCTLIGPAIVRMVNILLPSLGGR